MQWILSGSAPSWGADIQNAQPGEPVTLRGMVYKIRPMSGFAFVLLRTGGTLLQCVYSEAFSKFTLGEIKDNLAVECTGQVVRDERSRTGFEIRLVTCRALSAIPELPPVVINGRELDASLETLLDHRPVTLRNERQRAIFTVQAGLCAGLRAYLQDNGFTEIHTPKIVAGTAEGGANVFPLQYFGRPAFLCQSPQLYKQILVGVFERVYEIGPVFRAEKHDTARHVNEYTSVDLEMGFIDSFRDLMAVETRMLSETFASLRQRCADALALLGADVPICDRIPAIEFTAAKEMLAKAGLGDEDPGDFTPEQERQLGALMRESTGSDFVFITHYPSAKRPFYAMDSQDHPGMTESFDLLFRGMEVTTGGQRIHDYGSQIDKMKDRGMDIEPFSGYLMAHRYGLPPHGGLGIGLERLIAQLLGLPNVRCATLFPRDIHRLEP